MTLALSRFADRQFDSNLSSIILREVDPRRFKCTLYLKDGREVSSHYSLLFLDSLKRRNTDASDTGKLGLTPA